MLPISIVAGTAMTEEAKMEGRKPLFIDAFYDQNEPVARVILNMKSFLDPSREAVQEWGSGTKWTCQWADTDADTVTPQVQKFKTSGRTNLDGALFKDTEFASLGSEARNTPNVVADVESEGSNRQWAIVVTCPIHPGMARSPSARLNLVGERNGSASQ